MDDFNILIEIDEIIEHYKLDPDGICILLQGKKEDLGL